MEAKLKGGNIMAKRKMNTQNIEETPVELKEEVETEGSVSEGVVVDCTKLNVRKAPSKESKPVTIVDSGDTLKIVDADKNFGDWYKVITNNKVSGFCMKKYVKIN